MKAKTVRTMYTFLRRSIPNLCSNERELLTFFYYQRYFFAPNITYNPFLGKLPSFMT